MSPDRRLPHHPGLARLIADLPREQLVRLARAWDVDAGEGALAARLYRRMTDGEAMRARLNSLSPTARLILPHLAASEAPQGTAEILRRVPLAESDVPDALAYLEELGFIWRVAIPERGADGPLWQVPRDLQRVLRFSPPRRLNRGTENGATGKTGPDVPRPRPPPPQVVTGGQLPRLVSDWHLAREIPRAAALRALADHCGLALGVWVRARRITKPGPRFAIWHSIDDAQRTEALARLWIVDDDAPQLVGALARDAFWRALLQIEPQTWYDFDDVARFVGGLAAADRGADYKIGRGEIERAATVLRWIGLARLGRDRVGASDPGLALQLTDIGAGILRRRYQIPGEVGE